MDRQSEPSRVAPQHRLVIAAALPAILLAALAAAAPAAAQVTVGIEASDAQAAEAPADNGTFTVSRESGNLVSPVTVTYTVSGTASGGSDYAALSGSVTLGLFQGQATIPVTIDGDDGLFEGDETVVVTLDPAQADNVTVGANDAATVTIADTVHSITAQAGANATEDPVTAGTITVSLGGTNESGAAITVDYSVAGTATPGTDYTALSRTVEIAAGADSADIEVTPIADDLLESDETVRITLTSSSDPETPVGSPASATISIVDDDSAGDTDGDGIPNTVECPDFQDCRDTDGDSLFDYQDADDDGDGVPTADENPPDQDTDENGTPDYLDDDDDGDGRSTQDEDANQDGDGNPATEPTDLDGDDVADYLDPQDQGGPQGDLDGDGLTNEREEELGTDPAVADTDGDGVDDGAEDQAGSDPLDSADFADADGDLVPDAIESAQNTDPNDADRFRDNDNGGTADHVESVGYAAYGLPASDPLDPADDARDSDGDGVPDRLEIAAGSDPGDADSPAADGAGGSDDGVPNGVEAHLESIGITPVDTTGDFDRDGYPDVMEVRLGLDPLRAGARDSDGDGVPDSVEAATGQDLEATTDSDADGVPDAREVALGADPLDANSPVANGNLDDDDDGVTNAVEDVLATLGGPDDVDDATDTDGDGIADADEIRLGTDPARDERPVPWIELRQGDFGPVRAIASEGGTATAVAVTGGHQSGTLRYDWSGSDNAVLAVVSGGQTGRTLTFAPQTLPPGPYELVVRVQRTVDSYSSDDSVVRFPFDVLPGSDAADVADADNDGVPDSADDDDARRGFANRLPAHSGAQLQADPGVRLQLGSTARATQATAAAITREDIADGGDGSGGSAGNTDDDFDYLSGIYDFEVTNLPEPGAVVRIVIPQAAPLGEFPEYRKFRPDGGWGEFVTDDNNSIESAAASGGECPPPGGDAWQAGIAEGRDCIRLSIEDGGPNDADAADGPNGVIKDPSGVGTPKGQVTVGKGGGAAGPAALVVLGLLAVWARRRRIRPLSGTGALLAMAVLLAPPPAARADAFVGAGAGLSSFDPDTAGTPFAVDDDRDTGFKVFGGFDLTRISPHLSVEAFWADLGQATLENAGSVDYSVYGAGLSLGVSTLQTPRFSAFVEGGVAQLDISADVPFMQEDDTSLFLGLAGSYAVTRTWYLQLEYEYFAEDAQFLSLSFVKRFRGGGRSSRAKTIPLPDSRNDGGSRDLD